MFSAARSALSLIMLFLLAVITVIPCPSLSRAADEPAQGTNTLSAAEKAAGWKLLFDGKSTDGWRQYRGKKIPECWNAKDGALVFSPEKDKSRGDIVTTEQFDSFDLIFDWKISVGLSWRKNFNSIPTFPRTTT